jgi:hypothetical protein
VKCLIDEETDLDTGRVCPRCARAEDRRLDYIRRAWTNLPIAMLPGPAVGQRVGGTREAPLPLRVDPLDLAMPARVSHVIGQLVPLTVTRPATAFRDRVAVTERLVRDPLTGNVAPAQHIVYLRERVTGLVRVPLLWPSDGQPRVTPTDDQAGQLAAATILDDWVHDWRWHRDAGEGLPPAEVPAMVAWLRNRLQWALDAHPDLPAYSAGISGLHGALRAAVGDVAPAPEVCHGVPCRQCDLVALYRTTDGSGDIACGNCPAIMRAGEYDQWCRLLAAGRRNSEAAA